MILKRIFEWLWPGKSKVDEPRTTERINDANSITEQGYDSEKIDRNEAAKESVQIIIGFDFGTAFTKVVLHGAGYKFAVPLNDDAQGTEGFLLPTCLYESSTGNLSVKKPKDCQKIHTDLKMKILDGNLDNDTKRRIIIYIAHVLRKSRDWLMTEQKGVYGNNVLKWAINIGLPTENYENERLKETYIDLVEEAWYESTNFPESKDEVVLNDVERKLHRDMINAFPEFVAQIQGYINSTQRESGIHVLADVGAGTIDVTVFIVHQHEGENRHPILAAQVQKFGTIHLAESRCKQQKGQNGWRPSPQDQLPSCDEFAKRLGVSVQEVENLDEEFKQGIYRQINSCLQHAHESQPNQGDWESGVPLMLCGGGARVKFYETVYFQDVIDLQKRARHGQALRKSRSPELGDLNTPGLPKQDYDRLSVAYGLSFDALNIGEISHPSAFDAKKNTVPKRTCSRCRGSGGIHITCPKCGGRGFLSISA